MSKEGVALIVGVHLNQFFLSPIYLLFKNFCWGKRKQANIIDTHDFKRGEKVRDACECGLVILKREKKKGNNMRL